MQGDFAEYISWDVRDNYNVYSRFSWGGKNESFVPSIPITSFSWWGSVGGYPTIYAFTMRVLLLLANSSYVIIFCL